jgi:peptidoglycan/LPS O-acetylase OafA/YrhL
MNDAELRRSSRWPASRSVVEIPQLAFLRFIAAAGIVFFHCRAEAPSLAWGLPLWNRADTAVSFFFALSGFILAHVYGARGVERPMTFYVARVARIAPLYWMALAIIALQEWHRHTLRAADLGLSAVLLQSWVPGYSQVLDTPGWSLSVEVFFYLCFPFLLPILVRIRSTRALFGIMVGAWLANLVLYASLLHFGQRSSPAFRDFAEYHPLVHVATFTSGMAAGIVFDRHRDAFAKVHGLLMWGSLALFAGALLVGEPIVRYHHNGLFTPLFLAFLWGLGAAPRALVARVFSLAPFVLLGEASYGVYILQGPVAVVLRDAFKTLRMNLTADQFFWSYFCVLVAVAVLCFRFVEAPLRERIKAAYRSRSRPIAEIAG